MKNLQECTQSPHYGKSLKVNPFFSVITVSFISEPLRPDGEDGAAPFAFVSVATVSLTVSPDALPKQKQKQKTIVPMISPSALTCCPSPPSLGQVH